jgi:hypothetical protein
MRTAEDSKNAMVLNVCTFVKTDKIAGLATKIIIFMASALAEHRDYSQPFVENLQGMCVIWWC